PLPGRHIRARQPGRVACLTAAGALFVDRAGGDLLRTVLGLAATLGTVLHVFVLPPALRTPCPLWHDPPPGRDPYRLRWTASRTSSAVSLTRSPARCIPALAWSSRPS